MNCKTFSCSICNKLYSSNSSLSNHTRISHGIRKNNIERKYDCRYCNKEYIFPQSRWKHERTCKTKEEMEMAKIKEENERLLREKMEKNEEIIKLQKKLLNSKRMDNKTFKAVNKILMERSYKNSNNNNTINSNNTNTINNNTYQIFSLGNEDIINVLTYEQKKQIMNSRFCSLEKIVEITHCGNMNQFKNIIITNLKDNFA